jgi:hypothetical protein
VQLTDERTPQPQVRQLQKLFERRACCRTGGSWWGVLSSRSHSAAAHARLACTLFRLGSSPCPATSRVVQPTIVLFVMLQVSMA